MPRVQKLNVENLTPEDYEKCRNLNYRSGGRMRKALVQSRTYPNHYPGRVYMIKDDQGKLLSWALVSEDKVNFYTRESERKKGYGRQLSNAIAKEHEIESLEAGMHDEISEAFFSGTRYRKQWY